MLCPGQACEQLRPAKVVCVFMVLATAFIFSGCAQIPHKDIVEQPTKPLSLPPEPQPVDNGSIYNAAYNEPLFTDRRPRQVGDIVTVIFNENLSATKSSSAEASHDGNIGLDLKQTPDVLSSLLEGQSTDISGENDFEGGGGASASNSFEGRMTVTVRQRLANGNLVVAGQKDIGINQGVEYVRLSGTIDPRLISAQGTITSNKVADLRLSYYSDGFIDEAEHMSWLQRLWLNLSPL